MFSMVNNSVKVIKKCYNQMFKDITCTFKRSYYSKSQTNLVLIAITVTII